jgi:hypothetical protein
MLLFFSTSALQLTLADPRPIRFDDRHREMTAVNDHRREAAIICPCRVRDPPQGVGRDLSSSPGLGTNWKNI